MMKKYYEKPALELLDMETVEFIAGSLGLSDTPAESDALSRELDWDDEE